MVYKKSLFTERKELFFYLFVMVGSFVFLNFCSATVVLDANGNPFINSTNSTNSTASNSTINSTNMSLYPYYNQTLDDSIIRLINALIQAEGLNSEERAYLKALLEATTEERRQFQETLAKMDYAYKDAIDQRDKAVADKTAFETATKIHMETLDTEMEALRLDNVKTKAYAVAYIIFGLLFGVILLEILTYLKRNQKGYFIVRWIRDRIPIKI